MFCLSTKRKDKMLLVQKNKFHKKEEFQVIVCSSQKEQNVLLMEKICFTKPFWKKVWIPQWVRYKILTSSCICNISAGRTSVQRLRKHKHSLSTGHKLTCHRQTLWGSSIVIASPHFMFSFSFPKAITINGGMVRSNRLMKLHQEI